MKRHSWCLLLICCIWSPGKQTRRSARNQSVRESFRRRSEADAAGPATADHQPTAAAQVAPSAAPADRLHEAATAHVAASAQAQATAQPYAAETRRSGEVAATERAAADEGFREAESAQPGAQATDRTTAHGQSRAEDAGGDEHQAGLVPYSSSEGGDSEETLTDAIVISDKIVSQAATNTAQDVGDDVRGFGSDDVRVLHDI